jgi:hypothetical protein
MRCLGHSVTGLLKPKMVSRPSSICEVQYAHRQSATGSKELHPYLQVTERFTGLEPRFDQVLCLPSPAKQTHIGLLACMFHTPRWTCAWRYSYHLIPAPCCLDRRARPAIAALALTASAFWDMLRGLVEHRRVRVVGSPMISSGGDASRSPAKAAVSAFAISAVQRPLSTAEGTDQIASFPLL